jgi:hypothetical protein
MIASIGQPFGKYEEMVVGHDINGEILMTLIEDEKALMGIYIHLSMYLYIRMSLHIFI